METTGYFKEYYSGSKYIGRKPTDKDREHIGYRGKKIHVAESDIKFKNKTIKKGSEYFTILYSYNSKK